MFFGDPYEKTQADIDALQAALDIFPLISNVINRFDHKVYNKRFNAAIRDAAPGVWVHKTDYYISICGSSSYCDTVFCHILLSDMTNKRIDADAWNRNLKEKMLSVYKNMRDMKDILPKMGDIKAQAAELRTRRNRLIGSMPYRMRDYFGLKIEY